MQLIHRNLTFLYPLLSVCFMFLQGFTVTLHRLILRMIDETQITYKHLKWKTPCFFEIKNYMYLSLRLIFKL